MAFQGRVASDVAIPAVSAEELAVAFPIVSDWLNGNPGNPDPFCAPDIFSVLCHVKRRLDVDPPKAVAVFKRTLALIQFCADVELPKRAFRGRGPGRALLRAASCTPVRARRDKAGCRVSRFDPSELLEAFHDLDRGLYIVTFFGGEPS